MKIVPIEHGLDLLASNLVRSPGLHISHLYGDLFSALEPKRFVKGGQPHPLLTALGTAWEHHLEFLLDKAGVSVMRPGELVTVHEGIAYSPDGILEDDYRLAEYKYSSMGVKDLPTREATRFPPKFDKYVCQMKAYCYHLETPRARLYFCSTHSAWDPELLVYNVEFTARELKENWDMLMNHGRARKLL